MNKNEVVNIFWTGGLDSTFRALKLIVFLKKKVRPHHIIDPYRKSRFEELKAIENVKSAIFKRFPYTRDLLDDLIIRDLRDIGNDKMLHNYYLELTEKHKTGRQYGWLASYCVEEKIKDMEMCMHKPGANYDYLIDKVKFIEEDNDSYFIFDNNKDQTSMANLYQLYRYPLLDYTKLEMFNEARKFGFGDILETSWFCHDPIMKNKPCGTCSPCIIAREQGLKRRISVIGHIRYYLIVKTGLIRLVNLIRNYIGIANFKWFGF